MLLELAIEDLALFERARLDLGPGLAVVTGETGAGKSLLIGALELLLGQKTRPGVVRKGAAEARVEGRFVLVPEEAAEPAVRRFLAEHLPAVLEGWDKPGEERELVLSRSVAREGRSRAWIDHRPVALRHLRGLAELLVEIHGQNDHQRLLQPSEQLELLDLYGGLEPKAGTYRAARERWRELVLRRLGWEAETRDRRDRIELLRFQAAELEALRLAPGEVEELERERQVQRHASVLGSELAAVLAGLGGDDVSAGAQIARARAVIERWEGKVDALAPAAQDLRDAELHVEESLATVQRLLDGLEPSPERLEVLEGRLYAIEELARRYRTDAAGLLDRKRAVDLELAGLAGEDRGLEELDQACRDAREALERAAAELTRARQGLRAGLCKAVLASLARLGLERAAFDVLVEPRRGASGADATDAERFGPAGADRVEFLLCANPGEELRPLAAVASGGETARIMLALRTALAVRSTVPTLVFDEIDAGVGGRLGPSVGEHLRRLSEQHQVLCVTHLPAIAALAHHHFKVEKRVAAGRTRTGVERLEGRARVDEVADMIAGGSAHETARAEARRLLERAEG